MLHFPPAGRAAPGHGLPWPIHHRGWSWAESTQAARRVRATRFVTGYEDSAGFKGFIQPVSNTGLRPAACVMQTSNLQRDAKRRPVQLLTLAC